MPAARPDNPFDSLYVTETINPESFVSVFSPFLVHDTSALFQGGNVVLVGTQGSGKSMLLSLLKPETRLAYALSDQEEFPLEGSAARFIGGGINLTRSGAIDFGQRRITSDDDESAASAHFADFLNYWIVEDLLLSLRKLLARPNVARSAGVVASPRGSSLDHFAKRLAAKDCWIGALGGASDFDSLIRGIRDRIIAYRSFFNYNTDSLGDSIRTTKTSAGEPISVAARLLREEGVLAEDTNVFIRIDQYEELGRLEDWTELRFAEGFASVIHKMLGLRDPQVSYRIGTRRHSWPDKPRMQGTSAVLEELRNFKRIDLDEVLSRSEHAMPFPRFAEDVFRRRLRWAGYSLPDRQTGLFRSVFGPSPKPAERAQFYVGKSGSANPRPIGEVGSPVAEYLLDLAKSAPLEYVLAHAYLDQRGPQEFAEVMDSRPWETRSWWRKERSSQALLQLAARQKQRMLWSGADDIMNLSGANILVFVSLCQSIWDAHLRDSELHDSQSAEVPTITGTYVQNEGIYEASRYWHNKIRTDPDGDSRLEFVDLLGTMFRKWLRSDTRMSYPGHNGFSIDIGELGEAEDVVDFLGTAVDFGVLTETLHSTRNRGGRQRRKWYLAPIYSPVFQIPTSHTKEPKYVSVTDVRTWLAEAGVPGFAPVRVRARNIDEGQGTLFGAETNN